MKPAYQFTDHIFHQILMLGMRSSSIVTNSIREFGLSLAEFRVMSLIDIFPDTSASEIAQLTMLDKSKVNRAIHSLIQKEFVTKSTNTIDKRSNILELTATGRDIYIEAAKINVLLQSRSRNALSVEEFNVLSRILVKFDGVLNQLEAEKKID